jgi:hypothetical protein
MSDELLESTHDVYLLNKGDSGMNTIVLSGVDVVIPLEADLDDDPDQDDELRLRSLDGRVERVLYTSDEDATQDGDNPRFLYTFRNVPPGLYTLALRASGDVWATVMTGILITTKEATWQGKPLDAAPAGFDAADELPDDADDDEPPPAPDHFFYEYGGDQEG